MLLTDAERKRIFEDGREAAEHHLSRSSCPYSADKSPERIYIWIGGYNEYLTEVAHQSRSGIRPSFQT